MRKIILSLAIIILLFVTFGCSKEMTYQEYMKKTDNCMEENKGKYNVSDKVLEYACTKYVARNDKAVFEQVIKDLS